MDPYSSFAEDALPRSAPRPTVDAQPVAAAARPTVPEVSFLNHATALQPPQPSKSQPKMPASYGAWKKQNIVMTVDPQSTVPSASAQCNGDQSAVQGAQSRHKHVTFDTLPEPQQRSAAAPQGPYTAPILPMQFTTVPPKCSASLPTSAVATAAAMPPCSQLELSAFDPYSRLYSNPVPQSSVHQPIRIGAPDPSTSPPHQSNPFNYAVAMPPHLIRSVASPASVATTTNTTPTITDACAALVQHFVGAVRPPPVSPNLNHIMQMLSAALAPTTAPICTNPFIESPVNQSPSNDQIAQLLGQLLAKNVQLTDTNPPPSAAPVAPTVAIDLPQLHSIVNRQQEEIRVLQQQVQHLLAHAVTSSQQPTAIDASEPDEMALGEEASSSCVTLQPHSVHQHNQMPQTPVNGSGQRRSAAPRCASQQPQQSNHNSPADWKFYGNTLEQVLDVLHNSPGSGTAALRTPPAAPQQPPPPPPQVHNMFQVSHVQGAHFSDVNVSATQRVTYAASPSTAEQQQAQQPRPPPTVVTDRSLAMNSLALKYLDESGLHALVAQSQSQHQQQQHFAAQSRQSAHQRQTADMSAKSLDYLVKYGLLQNRRLFDANNNGDSAN